MKKEQKQLKYCKNLLNQNEMKIKKVQIQKDFLYIDEVLVVLCSYSN